MEAFESDSVCKDMNLKCPGKMLKVQYGDIIVQPGMKMTPTQVKAEPELTWDAEDGAYYLVIMNDPDAPSRADPKFGEWHHWMVGNIPGCNVSAGEVLSGYVGSGPPKGTDLHRYVFLVFKQPGKLPFTDVPRLKNNSGDGRAKHKAAEFIKKQGLGDPIAGNFYQAKWDDYVPKVYAQLSGK